LRLLSPRFKPQAALIYVSSRALDDAPQNAVHYIAAKQSGEALIDRFSCLGYRARSIRLGRVHTQFNASPLSSIAASSPARAAAQVVSALVQAQSNPSRKERAREQRRR
jgi:hypothetical protein